jgi:hypothetical protein
MATSPLSNVVQHLRRIAFLQECVRFKDEQLLEIYVVQREQAAFIRASSQTKSIDGKK